jgi:rod shape determining protein RodA
MIESQSVRHLGSASSSMHRRTLSERLHLDLPLLGGLILLAGISLVVLYSAGGQDSGLLVRQGLRLGLALGVMFALAQVPPHQYRHWTPWLYGLGLLLLVLVEVAGDVGKGAQRWLDLGLFRFQPSEIMKIALPLMVARLLSNNTLPPDWRSLVQAGVAIALPVALIARQPDLGTALLVASSGVFVVLLAGLRWRLVGGFALLAAALAPVLWMFMHDYQRQRVLTLLDPERDPLGTGYHIIQSKIAVGSGGLYGKGWLNGTQSHLDFLPERSTDFIFAVYGEEFGMLGALLLLAVFLYVVYRGLWIALQAQDSFGRLVGGSLVLTFFVYLFVNMGMVIGLLPVVGVPLPLISYGGTSLVTLMAGFGILMSIHTHRKLLAG